MEKYITFFVPIKKESDGGKKIASKLRFIDSFRFMLISLSELIYNGLDLNMPPPTTTHHQPKYVHHHPPPSTTTHHQPKYIHHHPPPAKVYPPLPTISQKMDHHLAKAKIYSYITSFRHCFNSSFFFEVHYSFPWQRFCVIKFWSVRFLNSKFLLHSVQFTIFKIF